MATFFVNEINNSKINLIGEEHKHLSVVMRKKAGDHVRLICNDEYVYEGIIESVNKNETIINIINKSVCLENPIKNLTVFQASLKQDKLELLSTRLSEIGATELVIFKSQNTENNEISEKKLDRINKAIITASKQCGRSKMLICNKFVAFDKMLELLKKHEIIIFANEKEKINKLNEIDLSSSKNIAVIIGSEGGFTAEEIIKINKIKSACSVSLGNRILRAETASIVLSAIVLNKLNEL